MTRRIKTIYLSESIVMNIFSQSQDKYICRIQFPYLPEDYKVEHTSFDMQRQAWMVIVSHESFDEVPLGNYPPQIEPLYSIVRQRISSDITQRYFGNYEKLTHEPLTVLNGETVSYKELNGKFIVEHRNSDGILLNTKTCENKIGASMDANSETVTFLDGKSVMQAESQESQEFSSEANNPFNKSWREKPSLL